MRSMHRHRESKTTTKRKGHVKGMGAKEKEEERERKRWTETVYRRCANGSVSSKRVLRYGSPVSNALKCESTLKSIVCGDETEFGK